MTVHIADVTYHICQNPAHTHVTLRLGVSPVALIIQCVRPTNTGHDTFALFRCLARILASKFSMEMRLFGILCLFC